MTAAGEAALADAGERFRLLGRAIGRARAVTVVLGTAGLVAAWLPARRATRVDPVAALRAE